MIGPGYVRPPVLPLSPSPPCAGTPLTASWMSKPAIVAKVARLLGLKRPYDQPPDPQVEHGTK
jgi:hypothetical protein